MAAYLAMYNLMCIYLIGSLRNPRVPEVAQQLRQAGYNVFDDWYSPGPTTDDDWQAYEKARGRTFCEALDGFHAKHVFEFDKFHLDRAEVGVLVCPAGKCAHLELGYMIGSGKPGYVLLEGEPERYDIMLRFADKVCMTVGELLAALHRL